MTVSFRRASRTTTDRFEKGPLRPANRRALAIGLLFVLFSKESLADQFVLFDATFTYTWSDAVNVTPSKSHYYVKEENWLNKQRPDNWVGPVNYRNGTVHIRVEVLEKPPGNQKVGWALCYVGNAGSYGCPYTKYYTALGVYENDADMRTFYNNNTIRWEQGVKQVDLVYTINDSGSGHISNFPDRKNLTTPTKVRITMVQVSAGSTYDPSILEENSGSGTEQGHDGGSDAESAESGKEVTQTEDTRDAGLDSAFVTDAGLDSTVVTDAGRTASMSTDAARSPKDSAVGNEEGYAACLIAPNVGSVGSAHRSFGGWLAFALAFLVRRRRRSYRCERAGTDLNHGRQQLERPRHVVDREHETR